MKADLFRNLYRNDVAILTSAIISVEAITWQELLVDISRGQCGRPYRLLRKLSPRAASFQQTQNRHVVDGILCSLLLRAKRKGDNRNRSVLLSRWGNLSEICPLSGLSGFPVQSWLRTDYTFRILINASLQ